MAQSSAKMEAAYGNGDSRWLRWLKLGLHIRIRRHRVSGRTK